MPIDKRARLRYRIINACFTNKQKRYWTVVELLEKMRDHDVPVEKRTLERDFEAMRYDEQLGYKAPIAYTRSDKTFYYSDPAYTINNLPITAEDLMPFRTATHVLQQYKGLPFVKEFEGVLDKLLKIVDQLDQPSTKDIIAFEQSPYYKGHAHVDQMVKAITQKQPLRIAYQKFDGSRNDHVLHPYFLSEYRGRWYVFGYSETRHYAITPGLDRMEGIINAETSFKENKVAHQKEYFKHTLGVTVGKGPVENIELWFSLNQAPYIRTQHLHHTQQTLRDDADGLVISLALIPNPELTQLILGYGAAVKVLSPLSLQIQVKEMIEGMGERYDIMG